MAGIAGIACSDRQSLVENMLDKIAHRGTAGVDMLSGRGSTLGVVWAQAAAESGQNSSQPAVWDAQYSPAPDARSLPAQPKPFALAVDRKDGVLLSRDWFGVRPLYYGYSEDGDLCFASEVKALLEATRDVHEFPPGTWYDETSGFHSFGELEPGEPVEDPAGQVAAQLLQKLEAAVAQRIHGDEMGSWLSGGLDSSVIVSLVRPHVRTLRTFAGGLPGAPDLDYARQAAEALDCEHREILLEEKDLLEALPEVIYFLESFDALLVRSTIVNYLVAKQAANWVDAVFSGEGADELFAGYAYLEGIPDEELPDELLDIVKRLHNTALQRVDRSAAAHGLVPLVPFLDLEVARYVLRIPAELKRGPQDNRLEKWILRAALQGRLPDPVLWRKKAKFWEGAGVGDLLNRHAEASISDRDFQAERRLPNGWLLNTKEELLYYRIFKEHFGEFEDLSWMGRTKGAPGSKPEVGAQVLQS